MKKSFWSLLVLAGFCAFLTGCATNSAHTETRARFHEAESANLVLRFSRWDTIYKLYPDSREAGFLPIMDRARLEKDIKAQTGDRNMAVVVFGFLFPPPQEAGLIQEWEQLLKGHGYKRVVILRTGASKSIDGLLIAHDSAIAAADDKTRATRTLSALSSAAGADAANPSGR